MMHPPKFASAFVGALVLVFVALPLAAAVPIPPPISPPMARGMIPEGMWVLNQQRSVKLTPGRQTLWIVKDDGDHIIWVSVERTPDNMVRVSSWDGRYDGQPVPVSGTAMVTHLVATGPSSFKNWGEIANLGPYDETCQLSADKRQLRCLGRVTTTGGVKTWVDDFDWASRSIDF